MLRADHGELERPHGRRVGPGDVRRQALGLGVQQVEREQRRALHGAGAVRVARAAELGAVHDDADLVVRRCCQRPEAGRAELELGAVLVQRDERRELRRLVQLALLGVEERDLGRARGALLLAHPGRDENPGRRVCWVPARCCAAPRGRAQGVSGTRASVRWRAGLDKKRVNKGGYFAVCTGPPRRRDCFCSLFAARCKCIPYRRHQYLINGRYLRYRRWSSRPRSGRVARLPNSKKPWTGEEAEPTSRRLAAFAPRPNDNGYPAGA